MKNVLFPELIREDKNTLFIIGNGFDLSHGIKSSYKDYYSWLKSSGHESTIHLADLLFSYDSFWNDMEASLGNYDEERILDVCRPHEALDFDHPTQEAAKVEDSPNDFFAPFINQFLKYFHDWVDSIDISDVKPVIKLPKDSLFFSFNYTETLENVYGIPHENVCHIHGLRFQDEHYIIGHNKKRDIIDGFHEQDLIFESNAKESIISIMNGFVKAYHTNMLQNRLFFDRLEAIDRIVIYGHSLGQIDWPYFDHIMNTIQQLRTIMVSWHNCVDLASIKKFQNNFSIQNVIKFYA